MTSTRAALLAPFALDEQVSIAHEMDATLATLAPCRLDEWATSLIECVVLKAWIAGCVFAVASKGAEVRDLQSSVREIEVRIGKGGGA